mgnify:FL=1
MSLSDSPLLWSYLDKNSLVLLNYTTLYIDKDIRDSSNNKETKKLKVETAIQGNDSKISKTVFYDENQHQ